MKKHEDDEPERYNEFSQSVLEMAVAIYGKKKVAAFCEINAFKYQMRLGNKDDIEKELFKKRWYLKKMKKLKTKKK